MPTISRRAEHVGPGDSCRGGCDGHRRRPGGHGLLIEQADESAPDDSILRRDFKETNVQCHKGSPIGQRPHGRPHAGSVYSAQGSFESSEFNQRH
jgi:hypothetical protein